MPNGDGVNDYFGVWANLPLTAFECQVFNRWRERVFYSLDVNEQWDGRVNGERQDMGVYGYFVWMEYEMNGEIEQVWEGGNVSLVW